jgi:[acyl-carrier-protein] S-malonyltransferase
MNVFLFPGQGSQEVGMGADLFRDDSHFQALVRQASQLVGDNLEPICLRGPERRLAQSRLLQPLLVAVSLGYLRRLQETGLSPGLVLGHSLGEITALAAAGVVSPEDAVTIAAKRGELMEAASAAVDGAMLAVMTDQHEAVLGLLAALPEQGRPVLANENSPQQIVLSGRRPDLLAFAESVGDHRLGRAKLLSVSVPSHSAYMGPAAEAFAAWLQGQSFRPPQVRLLLNSGEFENDPERIRAHVAQALVRPVRWRHCMAVVRELRPSALIEIGPGRVLAGLARANGFGDETRVCSASNLRGVELAARVNAD